MIAYCGWLSSNQDKTTTIHNTFAYSDTTSDVVFVEVAAAPELPPIKAPKEDDGPTPYTPPAADRLARPISATRRPLVRAWNRRGKWLVPGLARAG